MTAIVSLAATIAAFWLALNPPDAFAPYGIAGSAAWIVIVAAGWVLLMFGVLVKATLASIDQSLPEALTLTPVGVDRVPDVLRSLSDQITTLGFTRATPPLLVTLSQPAVFYGFVKDGDPVVASAFVIEPPGQPPVPSFDFVSKFESHRGGLTTSPNPAGSALPATPGSLRQVFPGGDPATLLEKHRESLAWLAGQGVRAAALRAPDFEPFFRESMQRQRGAFLEARLWFALTAIWRTVTKRTPHIGAIKDQAFARAQLRRLVGRT
jgi:hypothetical protein